jgi:hypothetical protein
MGFVQPEPPPFDLEEWRAKPLLSRLKPVAQDWAVNGFGPPGIIFLLYVVKLVRGPRSTGSCCWCRCSRSRT